MSVFNIVMDLLMVPLRQLPPELALGAYSVLTGFIILLLFKISSNPVRIAAARDRALARVLELWLFRQDAVGGLYSVGRAMLNSLGYLATMLKPALVSMLPMLIMLIQANAWFGAKPLQKDDIALVTVSMTKSGIAETLKLETPSFVTVEESVSSPENNEKAWRIRINSAEGSGTLKITGEGIEESKLIATGKSPARVSMLRTNKRSEHLLYPDEPLLPETIKAIKIAYKPAKYSFLGIAMPWIVYLLIVSMITGLILKKPLGVEF